MTVSPLGRLPVRAAEDVARVRQSLRLVAARLGFDEFGQVQIATGTSELARLLLTAGGGELILSLAGSRPRRLVLELAVSDRVHFLERTAGAPELIAARRLIGGPIDAGEEEAAATFSRLLPAAAPVGGVDGLRELLEQVQGERYDELQTQNEELLRALEQLQARDAELAALNAELEETNRGVLALYNELDDRAEAVRQASEERSRFLSNVTHELRTPLSSILALSRLLLTGDGRGVDEEQATQIKYIQKSAQDLYDFVSDLLDIAKFEAGKTQVHPSDFEIRDLFGALRGMFRPLATDPAVKLTFVHDAFPTLHTDEGKLGQILRNLISNALKFTEHGRVEVAGTYDKATRTATFTVTDTGIGIAPEDLSRIFDEFAQVTRGGDRSERGTGLGLPLSRTLATVLGGELTAESEPGRGSTFKLTVPIAYRPPSAHAGPALRALVVDDDAISRYVVKEQLERLGWSVIEAANGEMGFALLQEGAADVAVIDLLMPGTSGFELLARLREDPSLRRIPVAVRTSVPVAEIDRGAVRSAVGVFSKDDNTVEPLVRALLAAVDSAAAVETA